MNNPQSYKNSKKRWSENNKKIRNVNASDYKTKHPEKIIAHRISQKIKKKKFCKICGASEELERYHWGYDKPKLFNTLCNYCHNVQHHKFVLGGF